MRISIEKSVLELPFHDSDLLEIKVLQKDSGETDLLLNISFYKGEFESLGENFLKAINRDGKASILIENCNRIKIDFICNRTNRDKFDYFDIKDTKSEYKAESQQVEAVFISGSKIDCIAESVYLKSVE